MIIKGERVSSSRTVGPLVAHLLHGEENDAVAVLQGTVADIESAFADARAFDRKFALRHFIISPAVETSRADAVWVLGLLGREFGFDPAHATIVEHAKPRAVETAFGTHWHALVAEQDPSTGRTLSSKFSFLRNEKIARLAEHRLGHPLVVCAHQTAVLNALEADGEVELAEALMRVGEAELSSRPREAFSRNVHQMGKRLGADIPAARAAVRAAWDATSTDADFVAALSASQLCMRAGNTPGTFVVETSNGIFVGAAHRLARVRRIDMNARMKGASDVGKLKSETYQREGPFRATAHRDKPHQASNQSNQRGPDRQVTGRASTDVTGIDTARYPGPAEQSGSTAPAHRRYRAIRARGGARRLGEILRRNLHRSDHLQKQAAFLARPPAERVERALAELERNLETRIKQRIGPPPPSPQVLGAQARAKGLAEAADHLKKRLDHAERKISDLSESAPLGLGARFNGRRKAWEAQLSTAKAKAAILRAQCADADNEVSHAREVAIELARAEAQAHGRMIRAPDFQADTDHLRRRVASVQKARRQLLAHPALAWGGALAVLLAALPLDITKAVLEEEFGQSPIPRLLAATDIWGVGRLV